VVSFVTADRSHKQENDTGGREKRKNLPVSRTRQINLKGQRRRGTQRTPFPAPVEQSAKNSDNNTGEKKERGHDITEDADIGIPMTRKQVNREEQAEREEGARSQHHSRPANPVTKTGQERHRLLSTGVLEV
jgi:hypothetical protein